MLTKNSNLVNHLASVISREYQPARFVTCLSPHAVVCAPPGLAKAPDIISNKNLNGAPCRGKAAASTFRLVLLGLSLERVPGGEEKGVGCSPCLY
jgi:hypothetical protein